MARPLSQTARTQMMQTAADLALEVGVNRFTVDEVSKRSGIARTTIYRHFATSNQLLVAALDEITPTPAAPDTGSLRGDLLEFLASLVPVFADRQVRALFLDILAAASREPELMELHQSMMDKRATSSRAIFERAQDRGEIAPHFEYKDAFLIFEAPLVMRGLGPPGSLDDINLETHVAQILLVLGQPEQAIFP